MPVDMVKVVGSKAKLAMETLTSLDWMGGKGPAGVGPALLKITWFSYGLSLGVGEAQSCPHTNYYKLDRLNLN
ncbi:MAG: hypothetical protein NTW99_02895 [Chloroflexi bacterium]|nr:hypothetical protein [Chloroflexota bacterium]